MRTCKILWCLFAAIALMIAGSGCGSAIQMVTEDPEPKTEFGTPDSTGLVVIDCKFVYDPDPGIDLKKSLVKEIIDEVIDTRPEFKVTGGRIVLVGEVVFEGTRVDGTLGVLVFPNVPAGRYRLEDLNAINRLNEEEKKQWYRCTTEIYCPDWIEYRYQRLASFLDEFRFDVLPGEIKYLGRLNVLEWHEPPYNNTDETDAGLWDNHEHEDKDYPWEPMCDTFELKYKPKYELETLKKVIQIDMNNPWNPRLIKRIQELQAHTEQ